MSNDDVKESRAVRFVCIIGGLLFLGSILSDLDFLGAFYLFSVSVFVIRYFIAKRKIKMSSK